MKFLFNFNDKKQDSIKQVSKRSQSDTYLYCLEIIIKLLKGMSLLRNENVESTKMDIHCTQRKTNASNSIT